MTMHLVASKFDAGYLASISKILLTFCNSSIFLSNHFKQKWIYAKKTMKFLRNTVFSFTNIGETERMVLCMTDLNVRKSLITCRVISLILRCLNNGTKTSKATAKK